MSDISIDFSTITGSIKPMHGVNNGPVAYGSLLNVSRFYRELGVPYVRLHDPNWPHPREVDVPQIFPDFSKDPADPASYDFRRTDDYLASILDTGARLFYRLGVSIEHTARKYYTAPPADFEKWTQICLGIIRHYNHGWADGFHHDIRYWEIWNEPDNGDGDCMWSGTSEQYFALYRTAATAIKAFDPNLKVGGYAATSGFPDFTRAFLDICRREELPLDFFSWHAYTDDPGDIARLAWETKQMLDEHGFGHVESWLNEWNCSPGDWSRAFSRSGEEEYKRQAFTRFRSAEAASFVTALLLTMQELPIDFATYYDGQPGEWFCGLFDNYGVPQKPYYGFKAFTELVQCGRKVHVELDPKKLYCCAARGEEGDGAVVVSNMSDNPVANRLRLSGLPAAGYTIEQYLLDNEHDLAKVITVTGTGEALELSYEMAGHSVVLYRVRRR